MTARPPSGATAVGGARICCRTTGMLWKDRCARQDDRTKQHDASHDHDEEPTSLRDSGSAQRRDEYVGERLLTTVKI